MKMKHVAVVMGVGLMVVACGDDDDSSKPATQTATVNKDVAKSNAQSTITAVSATTGSTENGASVGQLSGAASGSGSLLETNAAGTGTRSLAQGLNFNIEGGIHPLDIGDPGCQCTGTSCSFSNCSFGTNGTSGGAVQFTIDGSYSWGNGHVTCGNLKYTFKATNLGGDVGTSGSTGSIGISTDTVVTMNCDITVTDTTITGFIQTAGNSATNLGQQAISSSWDIKSTYNSVTFDKATKNATGGSVNVKGTVNAVYGGQSFNYAGEGDVTF